MPMQSVPIPSPAAAVRRFNRFYTQQIGVLGEALLRSPFSLTEARVMFELAERPGRTAAALRKELGLDAGYLSRILSSFRKRGLVVRVRSTDDGREDLLSLSPRGRRTFAVLDARSNAQVGAMLERVPAPWRDGLIAAMGQIEVLLGGCERRDGPLLLRPEQPGDLGWIVQRHGALYAREYGYDEQFEALVADIVADFGKRHDPKRERCWIAERAGANVGSVLLVRKSQTVARLRLLLVEPSGRGLGIGGALVSECVRFARGAKYRKITLWTQSELRAARRLYEQAGFERVDEKPHHSFGRDLVGETWDLRL
jgi:DNA-binding MarR family transcriptional regulator/N-acetylglutamate synthase-like GNAT family acetyltransferase